MILIETPSVAVSGGNASGDGGIVVSIAAFQAVDPGSIPGHRSRLFALLAVLLYLSVISTFHIKS